MKPYYINENPELDALYMERKAIDEAGTMSIGDVMRMGAAKLAIVDGWC